MSKIKVLHFVAGLVSGGVEQMLCNYCGAMDNDKYEFVVVYQHEAVTSCKEKIEEVGCRTIRITARSENFFKNIVDSYNIIKQEQPDIVHAHMNLMNFCALFAAKIARVDVRISHSHIAEKNKSVVFKIMASVCKLLCTIAATDLMACGEEAGTYLYGKKRMKAKKVKIIENAVNLNYYNIDADERKKERSNNGLKDAFVVGHVGRFSYQKNHEKLIQIFYELKKLKPEAVLMLVGTGELEDEVKSKVEKLNLTNSVIFYGTTKDMKKVYSLLDFFVLPSRYEGFPVVSVEIQAARIPALFSDAIAPTCKLTDLIEFVSLNESDEIWAKSILQFFEKKHDADLTMLKEKYDVKENAKKLDNYYKNDLQIG